MNIAHNKKLASTIQLTSIKGLVALRRVLDSGFTMATLFTQILHS